MNEGTVNESVALVKHEDRGIVRPAAPPEALIEAHKEWASVINEVLEKDRDYGVIPGTGTKPTLLKPGAERLALAARFAISYDIVEQEIDHDREVKWTKHNRKWGDKSGTSYGLYRYVIRCRLTQKGNGQLVAEGLASASSMESKYIDRPRDMENTILKMGEKRSLIAAVLNALALSDRFTQDVEDMEFPKPVPQPKPVDEVIHDAVPVEEYDDEEPNPYNEGPPSSNGDIRLISEKQVKLVWAKLHGAFNPSQVKQAEGLIKKAFQVSSIDKIPAAQLDAVLKWIAQQQGK